MNDETMLIITIALCLLSGGGGYKSGFLGGTWCIYHGVYPGRNNPGGRK